MTTKIVKIPIYGGKLRVDIVDYPKESKLWKEIFTCDKSVCRRENGPPKTSFKGKCFGYKDSICIMLRRKCDNDNCKNPECSGLNPGTIAHEALHATFEILGFAGVKPDVKNQEPYAYLLSWVVNTVTKTVKEDKKRNS